MHIELNQLNVAVFFFRLRAYKREARKKAKALEVFAGWEQKMHI